MSKLLLLLLLTLGVKLSVSQTNNDTIIDFFQEIKTTLTEINFEEMFPKEELMEMKSQLKSSVHLLDSVLMTEQIPMDSIINQVKIDMQMVKQDISEVMQSEEFKEAQQDFIKELKAIIEELESSN